MAHAAGAGREDGEVGAPLPLQAKLVRLESFADLVVRDRGAVGRAHLGALTMDVDLLLPPNLQVIRRCGVVAMAINNHQIGEHTSELQSIMRLSYAVFCLKKKKRKHNEN